jgi:hypothetical protein
MTPPAVWAREEPDRSRRCLGFATDLDGIIEAYGVRRAIKSLLRVSDV